MKSYFDYPGTRTSKNLFIMAAPAEFDFEEMEGPNVLPWGRFARTPKETIKYLTFHVPDSPERYDKVPKGVFSLPNLQTLTIPSHFVCESRKLGLPKVQSLRILDVADPENVVLFPQREEFETIKCLDCIGYGKQQCSFERSSFPNLKHLTLCLTQSQSMLPTILEYPQLNVLMLGNLKNTSAFSDIALLKPKALALFRGSVTLEGIADIHTLKELWLRETREIQDLSPLLDLPRLSRLAIWHNKTMKNLSVLTKLPELKHLEINGCPRLSKCKEVKKLASNSDCKVEIY